MNLFKLKYLFIYTLKSPFNCFKLDTNFSVKFTSDILNVLNLNENDKEIADSIFCPDVDLSENNENFIFDNKSKYKYLFRGDFQINGKNYWICIHRTYNIPFLYNIQKKFLNNKFFNTFFLSETIYIKIDNSLLFSFDLIDVNAFLKIINKIGLNEAIRSGLLSEAKAKDQLIRSMFLNDFKKIILNTKKYGSLYA